MTKKYFKYIALFLCIVTVASLFATTADALGTVSGQSTVKSENIYVNGVNTGATHTQITLPAYSTYNPFGSAGVVNVVEVSPSSGLRFTALNCGTYTYNSSGIGVAAKNYNNTHNGTVIAAINADPWFLYHSDYDGDGKSSTGSSARHQSITRNLLIIDGEIYQTTQSSLENWLNRNGTEWGSSIQDHLVFAQNEDGTYMIGTPWIDSMITNDTTGVSIGNATGINRLPAPGAIMLYNHRIGTESMAYTDAYEIYLHVENSAFSIGETITGTVTGVYASGTTGRPAIDANTIVISARGKGSVPATYTDAAGNTKSTGITDKTLTVAGKFSIGDKVSIATAIRTGGRGSKGDTYDQTQTDKWNTVTTAIGGFYAQVTKGVVNTGEDAKTGAYPVPLIALKEDGTAMMITITSKSDVRAGTQQRYIGDICKELGAYTAIMFDGGGSTTMVTYEDGAYLRRASYADGSLRGVVNGLGLLYTGANINVTNSEGGARQDIDGVANSSSRYPDDGTTGGGTTTPPVVQPTEPPTTQPTETPTTPTEPSEIPTPDIVGSATSGFRYYANIDFINGTGPNGSTSPYQGIGGYKKGSAGTVTYSTVSSGVSADENCKVSVTGWAVVNGGQTGHYWSVDGTNWYKCVDTKYNLNMSNWNDIWAAAVAGAEISSQQSASEANAKFTGAAADLTPWAGQTVTVYFGVGTSATPTSVAMMCKIENVAVPAKHTHTPGAAATCTTAQTCTGCGEVIAAALGHDEVSHSAKAATCTEGGYEAYVSCSRCDYSTKADTAPLGHDEVSHAAKPATCAEEGYNAYVTCSRCDYSTKEIIPATGAHKDNNNDLKCDTCDKNMACEHKGQIATLPAKAPTCTETGLTEGKKCLTCNEIIQAQNTVNALGHAEISHAGKPATCTEAGYEAYVTCSACGYTTYKGIAKLGHDKQTHTGKPATCSEDGYKAYETCSRCDYTTYEKINATGEHIDADHNLACDRCNAPMNCIHDGVIEVLDAVAPTCTKTGLTEGTRCTLCYVTLVKQEVVAALGHDEISHAAKAATCTESGYDAYVTCSRCEYTTKRDIAPLGHETTIQPAKSATCTEAGNNAYMTCSRCDYTTKNEISPLGHDAVIHPAKNATCTEAGNNAYITCSRCDYTTYAEIPTIDHAYDDEYDADCNSCGAERTVPEKPTEPAETPTDDKGDEGSSCRSSVGFGVIAIIASIALAGSVIFKKKRN